MTLATGIAQCVRVVLFLGCVIGRSTWTRADEPKLDAPRIAVTDDDSVIDSFPVDKSGGTLLIPVTIGEKQLHFILDTGCNMSIFGPALRASLNPTGRESVVNGETSTELFECPAMTIGRLELKAGQLVVSTDLSGFQAYTRHPVSGILGMDFLSGKLIQIDFDAGRVVLFKRGTHVASRRVALHYGEDDLPRVEIDLPGIGTEKFLVDTGCGGFQSGILSTDVFDRLFNDTHLQLLGQTPQIALFFGSRETRKGTLTWLSLAGERHEMQFFTEDISKNSTNGIGLGYLARYRVTLDFEKNEMILEKGKRFSRVYPANWAGIDIATKDGVSVVLEVEKDGPAWTSGIRAGDRIVSIDGTDATAIRLDQIGCLLQCRSRHELRVTWGSSPLFTLQAPDSGVTVKVLRLSETHPREFRLSRKRRISGAESR